MSDINIHKNSKDISKQFKWNILKSKQQGIKIDEKYTIKISKRNQNLSKEIKESCKVLHFTSDWNFEDVLSKIIKLNPREYPHLFIFIIDTENYGFSARLQEILLKFCNTRPMILQLASDNKDGAQIYYQNENSRQFTAVNQQLDQHDAFQSILQLFFLNTNTNKFEDDVLSAMPHLQSRSTIINFLQALKLSDEFFSRLIRKITINGTKSEFLAALDAPFETEGRMLSNKAQHYISGVNKIDENQENYSSVLLEAIKNRNAEVIDYLLTYWTHLIQQLPFEHQIRISTAALDTNQLDFLCDLINVADYPFPKDYKANLPDDSRLCKIIKERAEFRVAIDHENYVKIDEFVNSNMNLRFLYNPSNNSALADAINLKKFGVFYYLKSFGLMGVDCDDVLEKLSQIEKEQAIQQAAQQRKQNVRKSQTVATKSVMLLSTRSTVHNYRTQRAQAEIYRDKIMQWFEDIYKVAPEMIDVAASCKYLKIIFDFESDSVENASLAGSNSSGTTYPISKWIFIGAKLLDQNGDATKQREQQIKGVLAHEICHYVMKLVYENQENPYYKNRRNVKKIFTNIVKILNRWSSIDLENPDDECNGIISKVFRLYSSKDFHQELIVRVVHMLTEFDDDEQHSAYLQQKYQILIDFWQDHVMPELRNYLLKNKNIIRLNGYTGILNNSLQHQISVKPKKDIQRLMDTKLAIAITNNPTLLFIDICKNLKEKSENLVDTNNFFTNSKKLSNSQIWNDLKQISHENQELKIFIDCTKDIPGTLENLLNFDKMSFVFVVSNVDQTKELMNIFNKNQIKNTIIMEMKYNWTDLTEKSQNLLLQKEVKFQNNSQIKLINLLKNEKSAETNEDDLSQIIDGHTLNLLVENKEVALNLSMESEKNFNLIYQSRKFLKKQNRHKSRPKSTKLSLQELLDEVKNKPHVLISDMAGNGKSWAMKSIALTLKQLNPSNWVTYIDLKQYIDEFKAQKNDPDFSTFIVEKILRLRSKFEIKLFQKLYHDGKVFIFFDGFDEIAPNCAEFVSKLAQNFEKNGGNQLWISTRDYFEEDLKEKLNLNTVYSLYEMTKDEGIDVIARTWILMDLKNPQKLSQQQFEDFIKCSSKYENYKQQAIHIIKKSLISSSYSVGLPQLFRMIADGFKDEKNVDKLNEAEIFIKFIKKLYTKWSHEKGQIRMNASINSLRFEMSFWKFHQYHAILSIFPELAAILFPDYDGSEWPELEIIACGLITIKNGKVYFLHETFQEFFIADFITKSLQKSRIDDKVVELFTEILTIGKYVIFRMFLNGMINNDSMLRRIQQHSSKHIEQLYKMTSFADLFICNHIILINLVVGVFKNGNYERVKTILYHNAISIARYTGNSETFIKFQNFAVNFLKSDDLKDLIISGQIFQEVIKSRLDIKIFVDLVTMVEAKTGREFIRQDLKMMSQFEGNICQFLSQSSHLNAQKVRKFLRIMEEYFTAPRVIALLRTCNKYSQTILQVCVESNTSENFKILWTEIEKYFAENPIFKEFVKQHDMLDRNILHLIAKCNNIEVVETFWNLLLSIIKSREELKDFILATYFLGSNFLHELVKENTNPSTVELIFNKLSYNLTSIQFQELLYSENYEGMSLLQSAASKSKIVEIHQFLWKTFHNFFESDKEFLEILKKVDCLQQNVLQIAAKHSSSKIFQTLIQELEKFASRDEIREILASIDDDNRNILQTAAFWNRSADLHTVLWATIGKYFEPSEILKIIRNVDIDGNNLFFNAIVKNKIEVLELTWNEIKCFMSHDEQVIFLKIKGEKNKNLFECSIDNEIYKEELRNWINDLNKEYEIHQNSSLNCLSQTSNSSNADISGDRSEIINASKCSIS